MNNCRTRAPDCTSFTELFVYQYFSFFVAEQERNFKMKKTLSLLLCALFLLAGYVYGKVNQNPKAPFTIVFFQPDTTANPVEGNIALQLWCDHIGEKINRKLIAKFFISKDSFENFLDAAKPELAILNPLYIIENYNTKHIEPLLVAVRNNNPYYQRCLIIRNDGKINDIADLHTGRLVTTQIGESTLDFIQKVEFCGRLNFSACFSAIQHESNPRLCIASLLNNEADAALVPLTNYMILCELDPKLEETTKPMLISQKIPLAAACCFTDRIDKKEVQPIVDAALQQHTDPKGQQTFLIFKADKWQKTSLDIYKNLQIKLQLPSQCQ